MVVSGFFIWVLILDSGTRLGIQKLGSFFPNSPCILDTLARSSEAVDFEVEAVVDDVEAVEKTDEDELDWGVELIFNDGDEEEELTNLPSAFKNFSNLSFWLASDSSFDSWSFFSRCFWNSLSRRAFSNFLCRIYSRMTSFS